MKKWIAMLLALCLSFSLLAGCQPQVPETQPTTPSLVTTGSFTATPALVPRSIVKV